MTIHDQVIAEMKKLCESLTRSGLALQLPHPSGKVLGTRYTEMAPGKVLAAEFPFNPQFTNPLHMFQGGMLSAIIDEVFGPLTWMAAGRPAVTVEMSTTYLRPFTASDTRVTVKAEVVSKTKTLIVLKAEVKNPDGKLVATATNHSLVASDEFLVRPRH